MFKKLTEKTENMHDPNAVLEKALMEEYLHERGYSLEKLKGLPKEMVEQLMKDATRYASLKMEEVKAKAHFVEEIHERGSSSHD
jgi:phosphotransacetylase